MYTDVVQWIVDSSLVKGKIIGTHPGVMYFTIGERLGESKKTMIDNKYQNKIKGKLYVAGKDKKSNILLVAPDNHPILFKKQFKIIKVNWLVNPKNKEKVKVRIRHLGPLIPATIIKKNKTIKIKLNKGVRGLAEGQSCVIYKNSQILGGGEIRYT